MNFVSRGTNPVLVVACDFNWIDQFIAAGMLSANLRLKSFLIGGKKIPKELDGVL